MGTGFSKRIEYSGTPYVLELCHDCVMAQFANGVSRSKSVIGIVAAGGAGLAGLLLLVPLRDPFVYWLRIGLLLLCLTMFVFRGALARRLAAQVTRLGDELAAGKYIDGPPAHLLDPHGTPKVFGQHTQIEFSLSQLIMKFARDACGNRRLFTPNSWKAMRPHPRQ